MILVGDFANDFLDAASRGRSGREQGNECWRGEVMGRLANERAEEGLRGDKGDMNVVDIMIDADEK